MKYKNLFISIGLSLFALQALGEVRTEVYEGTSKLKPDESCAVELTFDEDNKVVALDAYGYGEGWVLNVLDACEKPDWRWRCLSEGIVESKTFGGDDLKNPVTIARFNFETHRNGNELRLKGADDHSDSVHIIEFTMQPTYFKYKYLIDLVPETPFPLVLGGKSEFECENLQLVTGQE
jgi:hypothetical protein